MLIFMFILMWFYHMPNRGKEIKTQNEKCGIFLGTQNFLLLNRNYKHLVKLVKLFETLA